MKQNKTVRRLTFFFLTLLVIAAVSFVASRQFRLNWQLASAIGESDVELVRSLLQQGGDPNLTMGDRKLDLSGKGISALDYATMFGNNFICLELVRHGAKVNLRPHSGNRLLELAVIGRDEALLDALLQNYRQQGTLHHAIIQEALSFAVATNSQNIIKNLVRKGADVNDPPAGLIYHNFPSNLILAVKRNPDPIPLLLQLGADPKFKDADGKTALDYARQLQPPAKRNAVLKALQSPQKKS